MISLNKTSCSFRFLLLCSNFASSIGDLHSDLLSSLHNLGSLLGTHVVGDLSAESSVVHQQNIQILDVVNHELLETVGKVVFGGVVRSVTDSGHILVASESSPHSVVDTSGSSPALGQSAAVEVGLESGELQSSLLDDSFSQEWGGFDH